MTPHHSDPRNAALIKQEKTLRQLPFSRIMKMTPLIDSGVLF